MCSPVTRCYTILLNANFCHELQSLVFGKEVLTACFSVTRVLITTRVITSYVAEHKQSAELVPLAESFKNSEKLKEIVDQKVNDAL